MLQVVSGWYYLTQSWKSWGRKQNDKMNGLLKRLVTLMALGVSLLLLAACGSEQQQTAAQPQVATDQTVYEWKMITSWPKNLPALGTSPEYFADIVETMSQGRMRIRVYGANELVGGLEVFDAVSQGVAEIGHSISTDGPLPCSKSLSRERPSVVQFLDAGEAVESIEGRPGFLVCLRAMFL